MPITQLFARHFRDVHFGGNWTTSSLKQHLSDLSLIEATTKIGNLNTILTLVYHVHYYVAAVTKVLEGESLQAKDEYSFHHPEFKSEEEWQQFLEKVFSTAMHFASLIEKLPDGKLLETFEKELYGNYFRNIAGIIEHTHYHLGQIVVIKKLVRGT